MILTLLAQNPLLALLTIIAIGYLVGRVHLGSFSLGVSAVLFTGMAFSAFKPTLALPDIVYVFGLALFVYTIGLSSGPSFFLTIRKKGLSLNLLAVVLLVAGALGAYVLAVVLKFDPIVASGMYTGAFTNTPALAGLLDALQRSLPAVALKAAAAKPVIGYSLAYPLGVMGVIAAISLLQRVWRIDHAKEGRALATGILDAWIVRVLRTDRPKVGDIAQLTGTTVTTSRIGHDHQLHIAKTDDELEKDDTITIVGPVKELKIAMKWLGERSDNESSRTVLDYRRMFVSNPKMVGRTLGELQLQEEHGLVVTRIRRGDIDLLAHDDSVLELGDRVRVVAPRDDMVAAAKLFGDSYHSVSEMDVLTFAVGLSIGVLIGLIPIPLPGGGVFSLGSAGGPLVVALVLGALGRTGPILWQVPYGVNITLRQVGVVLFLAGIGTRAGGAFAKALSDTSSLVIIAAGGALTFVAATTTLYIGHKLMKLPFGQVAGVLAGLQTQPAALAYANEQAGNELPNLGYTTVYPLAMIGKIVLAQLLLVLLSK